MKQHKYVLQKYKFVTAEPTNPSKTAKQTVELTKAPPNLPNPSQPFQTWQAILNSRYWLQLCGLGWDVSANCLYWHLKGKHIQELNCLWRYINHPFGVIFVIVKQILLKTSRELKSMLIFENAQSPHFNEDNNGTILRRMKLRSTSYVLTNNRW